MAMAAALTRNAILALNSGETDLQPLVQVLDVRQIGTGQSVQERYRLVLSDGNYVQQAMLNTQLNEFVKSGQVQKGSIVKLVEYICDTVQSRNNCTIQFQSTFFATITSCHAAASLCRNYT
ncbi:hypothetical protein L7F22_023209 [Adiantum nelumboides]|nr:hypothetical protein [Adiantum nelumboides]